MANLHRRAREGLSAKATFGWRPEACGRAVQKECSGYKRLVRRGADLGLGGCSPRTEAVQ